MTVYECLDRRMRAAAQAFDVAARKYAVLTHKAHERARAVMEADLSGEEAYPWVFRLQDAQARSWAARRRFHEARHAKTEASLRFAAWCQGTLR